MRVHAHLVRYHEVDQQGFLFNGRFMEIADVAMAEFFRMLGWTYPEMNALGFDPSVASVTAQFRAPARYDDALDADVRCTRVGTSSFDIATRITRGDEVVAELQIVYVNVNAAQAASVRVPESIAEALRDQASRQEESK